MESISPERWQQVKILFQSAIALERDERAEFLSRNCQQDSQLQNLVERMIAADEEAASFLEESPVQSILASVNAEQLTGKRVGHYRIIQELGRGGMGAVFLARREDEFEKVVALKIIKRGMDTDDTLRRFRNERQILAHLDHPNIARLLDGGTTDDGLPYFVLEYVNGSCIDEYCNKKQLSITDRLKLFRQVCDAVSYAHQRLAIHRDIKPSNILVTDDGVPKLLDFGIAKLLTPEASTSETVTGMRLMTPEYASPEQARGDSAITTATDVYSLGVVLFELLTGKSPYRFLSKRADEVARVICETEPERPSRVANGSEATRLPSLGNKRLRGDLDNILLMALRKDPARRYNSVEQFSEDIRRHLEGQPVIARPDTFRYRASKFITRNRAATIGAVIFTITLLTGVVTTFYQARVANRERAKAERRFSEVRELAKSVVFEYHDAIAKLPGSTQVREMLVKDALQYLDNLSQESAGDRSLQRELALAYLKVGDVQGRVYDANLGNVQGALQSYRKAIVLFESLAQDKTDIQAQTDLRNAYQTLALTMANGGDPEASTFIEKAISLSEELAASNPNDSNNQLMLARSYVLRLDARALPPEDRFELLRKALAIVERLVAKEPNNAEALKSAGVIEQRLGDQSLRAAKVARTNGSSDAPSLFKQAIEHHRRSGERVAQLLQLDPKNNSYNRLVAIAANNLGEALLEDGNTKNGVIEINRGLAYFAENARTDPANLNAKYEYALSLQTYAQALLRDGQVSEAKKKFSEVAGLADELIKKDSRNREYMNSAVTLREEAGDALLHNGSFSEALDQYRAARNYLERLIELAPSTRALHESRSDTKFGDYYLAVAEHVQTSSRKREESKREACRFYQSALERTANTDQKADLAQKISKCK